MARKKAVAQKSRIVSKNHMLIVAGVVLVTFAIISIRGLLLPPTVVTKVSGEIATYEECVAAGFQHSSVEPFACVTSEGRYFVEHMPPVGRP